MAIAYIKPGVTVSEVTSPAFSPLLLDPTSICVIGPSQGYERRTETILLTDNYPVALKATNPSVASISVVDASNVTLTPFVVNTDYTLDTSTLTTDGLVKIARAMQTTIAEAEKVVVYFENSASPVQSDGKTEVLELDLTTAAAPVNRVAGTQIASLTVAKQGKAPNADFSIVGAGTATVTIVWVNTATVLSRFQTVYLDYTVAGTQFTDVPIQLNNITTVSLAANSTGHVVKLAPGASTSVTSTRYAKGTTTDLDYIVTGTGATTTITRSAGSTTMGVAADKIQVRVTYNATPSTYWLPTRCFSQSDVDSKYGPAFDAAGNILNPVSFAAGLAFEGGAPSVIIQALFSVTNGVNGAPTGSVNDWQNTLLNLRNIEDVNVLVPLISTGTLTTNDALNLSILSSVQDHCNFMLSQDQYVVALCGEDATKTGQAAMATLRTHAQTLAARTPDDQMVLISPATFSIQNPIGGNKLAVGGQYAAATLAGLLARFPVQSTATRRLVPSLIEVGEARSEADKNSDGAAGLLVIESKRGRIQVRHAITVSRATKEKSELSVVRAKHYMMENIRESLDTEVIGAVVLDNNANFRVQLIVEAVLNRLVDEGAIVSFHDVQVRRDPNDATRVQVRFSYLPAYPLNNITVSFSIDSSQGVTFSDNVASSTQGF